MHWLLHYYYYYHYFENPWNTCNVFANFKRAVVFMKAGSMKVFHWLFSLYFFSFQLSWFERKRWLIIYTYLLRQENHKDTNMLQQGKSNIHPILCQVWMLFLWKFLFCQLMLYSVDAQSWSEFWTGDFFFSQPFCLNISVTDCFTAPFFTAVSFTHTHTRAHTHVGF